MREHCETRVHSLRFLAYQQQQEQQQNLIKNICQNDMPVQPYNKYLFNCLKSNKQNNLKNVLNNKLIELDSTSIEFLVYNCLKCNQFNTNDAILMNGFIFLTFFYNF